MFTAHRTMPPARCLLFRAMLLSALCLAVSLPVAGQHQPPPTPGERADKNIARLEEVWRIVDEHFFDPQFNGADWPAMLDRYAPAARQAESDAELAVVINGMLAELDTSHTTYFTQRDPAYYQLLDVFSHSRGSAEVRKIFPDDEVRYAGTGIVAEEIEGKIFIKGIIDGMPADRAGLRVGDEIVSVDGRSYEPRASARRRPGPALMFQIQRTPDAASRRQVEVDREVVRPSEMFLRAMNESVAVHEQDGLRIGSLHIWSWAGEHYQGRLIELLGREPLRSADALVLDIRDGWGGARTWYLNIFNRNVPVMTMKPRDGEAQDLDMHWRKPVVLLINGGSRSGKEIIAYGFKTYGIGPVVGTPTGGAVTGGRGFVLSNGDLLYLAVADVLVDGQRLEGVGVEPDVAVEFDIPYAAGADPQLRRAVEVAAAEVRR
jgi:carboxyl-terminal processing protease